jgi:hypothetical protein
MRSVLERNTPEIVLLGLLKGAAYARKGGARSTTIAFAPDARLAERLAGAARSGANATSP